MAGKTVPFGNPRRPAPEELDAFVHGSKPVEQAQPVASVAQPLAVIAEDAAKPAPKVLMKRLTFDIPADLHRRMKLACVGQDRDMADVLRELIEQRFPAV